LLLLLLLFVFVRASRIRSTGGIANDKVLVGAHRAPIDDDIFRRSRVRVV